MTNSSPMAQAKPYTTDMLDCLTLIHQGKVRDSFALDDNHMLIVASDRLSAFDVVLPDPVPGKGALLTKVSNFWFEKTRDIIDNHLTGIPVGDIIADPQLAALLEDRSVVVRRLKPLPVEAIVRGYLIGSGWKDYQQTGSVMRHPSTGGVAPGRQVAGSIIHTFNQGCRR